VVTERISEGVVLRLRSISNWGRLDRRHIFASRYSPATSDRDIGEGSGYGSGCWDHWLHNRGWGKSGDAGSGRGGSGEQAVSQSHTTDQYRAQQRDLLGREEVVVAEGLRRGDNSGEGRGDEVDIDRSLLPRLGIHHLAATAKHVKQREELAHRDSLNGVPLIAACTRSFPGFW
jgi:hypothetical protein